ncbi:protein YgfX [Dongshaea marina]|uniref:protein YgfX n=1 Tax=Dongshaea marina TaxID=2047966 RepID=UPI00131F0CBF|nr:protein YgfX [Dongshaea marina]
MNETGLAVRVNPAAKQLMSYIALYLGGGLLGGYWLSGWTLIPWAVLLLLAFAWSCYRRNSWLLELYDEGECRLDGQPRRLTPRSRVGSGFCLLHFAGPDSHWRIVWDDALAEPAQFRQLARYVRELSRQSR